jgi:hypothetical protein
MSQLLPILPYAAPEREAIPERGGSGMAVTIFLGLFQFFWIGVFIYHSLGWDGPKHLVADSFYEFLMAVPSIAALIDGFCIGQDYFRKANRVGPAIVCFLVSGISAVMVVWQTYAWVVSTVLDPHGGWYPL